jgi:hypothetical protein
MGTIHSSRIYYNDIINNKITIQINLIKWNIITRVRL